MGIMIILVQLQHLDPGSSPETLQKTLQAIKSTFADDYRIFPGHELDSTIGREKKHNPYF